MEEKENELNENNKIELTEGRRMVQLRKALEKTVEKCVSSGKISLLRKHFPNLFHSRTKSFQEIHTQYQQHLRDCIKQEIETMFSEEMVSELLNELDKLEEGADQLMWRPSGDPETDVRAHIVAVKLKQKEKLQSILDEQLEENKKFEEALLSRRAHLSKTLQRLEERINRLAQTAVDLHPNG